MSGAKGFKLIGEEEVAPPAEASPEQAKQSAAMVMLALRALSARAATAITNLFTIALVASAWMLWGRVLDSPTDRQLIALGGYGVFCVVIDIVRRRSK